MWESFMNSPSIYCRPFIDFTEVTTAVTLQWYTDASGVIGIGGIFDNHWFYSRWDRQFLVDYKPSIEFQELLALAISVELWLPLVRNKRICLHCDNQSVVAMVNSSSSKCKNCMYLIRRITLRSMECNTRVFAVYVNTKANYFADALSRNQLPKFWSLVAQHG